MDSRRIVGDLTPAGAITCEGPRSGAGRGTAPATARVTSWHSYSGMDRNRPGPRRMSFLGGKEPRRHRVDDGRDGTWRRAVGHGLLLVVSSSGEALPVCAPTAQSLSVLPMVHLPLRK